MCTVCDAEEKCIECSSNHFLEKNTSLCVYNKCSEVKFYNYNCYSNLCKENYYASFENCIQDTFNVIGVINLMIFSKCIQSFYYEGGKCLHCPSTCSACLSSKICTMCNSGYYLSGDYCFKCSENCLLCNNPYVCKYCDSNGYALVNDKCTYMGEGCYCGIPIFIDP